MKASGTVANEKITTQKSASATSSETVATTSATARRTIVAPAAR
jgi:hypothetical protein